MSSKSSSKLFQVKEITFTRFYFTRWSQIEYGKLHSFGHPLQEGYQETGEIQSGELPGWSGV